MIQITATDLKTNLKKYLSLATKENIYITKNGKNIAVLTPFQSKDNWLDDLVGIIPNPNIDEKKALKERAIQKYESLN